MQTIDDILTAVQQYANRGSVFDTGGNLITTAFLSTLINQTIHEVDALIEVPEQTYGFSLTLTPNLQTYTLQPSGTTNTYRATLGITLPNQLLIQTISAGVGWPVNYLTHEQARRKYQLVPPNAIVPGPPSDYSIFSGQYWFWPGPNAAYIVNIDQRVNQIDLVAAQTPAQSNFITKQFAPFILFETVSKLATVLKDQTLKAIVKPDRDAAWLAVLAVTAQEQFGEMGETAQMVEMG